MTKGNRRTFSAEFKAQVVLEVISGVKTFTEACRQYQLSEQTLSRRTARVCAECRAGV